MGSFGCEIVRMFEIEDIEVEGGENEEGDEAGEKIDNRSE